MDIDKLIEEKTECFTGNGDYYFTYVTPEDCKKIVKEALKQGQSLPIDSVSNCDAIFEEASMCDIIEDECPKCGSNSVGAAFGMNECFDCQYEWA